MKQEREKKILNLSWKRWWRWRIMSMNSKLAFLDFNEIHTHKSKTKKFVWWSSSLSSLICGSQYGTSATCLRTQEDWKKLFPLSFIISSPPDFLENKVKESIENVKRSRLIISKWHGAATKMDYHQSIKKLTLYVLWYVVEIREQSDSQSLHKIIPMRRF